MQRSSVRVAGGVLGDARARDGDGLAGEGSFEFAEQAFTPSRPNSLPSRLASVSPSV